MPDDEARADAMSGRALSAHALRELAAGYLDRIQQGDSFTDDDYIAMVKLFNTIGADRLAAADPLFARYADAFFPAQVEPAARRLGAVATKGMALYSRRHDLYIGGPAHGPSRYRIEG
jgi:hypothetical protein